MAEAKVGLFGIGLAAYWPQFPGLKERLEGYQAQVEARLAGMGAEVISAGLVDAGARGHHRGRHVCVRAGRPDHLLCRHIRHVVAGAAGRRSAGRRPC